MSVWQPWRGRIVRNLRTARARQGVVLSPSDVSPCDAKTMSGETLTTSVLLVPALRAGTHACDALRRESHTFGAPGVFEVGAHGARATSVTDEFLG
jgi:hypothetical protein